jgi:hypothetical protein
MKVALLQRGDRLGREAPAVGNVGLVVTAAVYRPWAARTTDVPSAMIYPPGAVAVEEVR